MLSSRRNFLRRLGLGAASGIALNRRMTAQSAFPSGPEPVTHRQGGPIRLDRNESAYGPSDLVLRALRSEFRSSNRYPEESRQRLIAKIASSHSVPASQIVLGCGSTEVLRTTADALLGPGKRLVQATPTFDHLEDYARAAGAEIVSVPLKHDHTHDVQRILERTASGTGLVYVCNPNNPTGTITPRETLEKFIAELPSGYYVLIDEAYHHYVGRSAFYASFLDQPLKDDRVIVTRSFSAAYGLAGLRVGYGIAAEAVAARLCNFCTKENLSCLAIQGAIAALEDQTGLRRVIDKVANDRQEFRNEAGGRMLKPIDSHTNFVMMDTYSPADAIVEHFRSHEILIATGFPGMNTHVRVSLGDPQEMNTFWQVWDRLPKEFHHYLKMRH